MFLSWLKNETHVAADLYIDLGTANTIIAGRKKGVLLNEPSLVAYQKISAGKKRLLAFGNDAKNVLSKNPGNVFMQKPVRDGVIADFESTEQMLRHFLKNPIVKNAYSRPRIIVSLPYGVTEVEKKAVVDTCKFAGAKEVFLIDEPMVAAIGAGIPIKSPLGHMIVDIGGGTTEVAIIALADIVYCEGIRVAGHRIDEEIMDYLKREKHFVINESTAEEIKHSIGTAMPKKDIQKAIISGRDLNTGLSKQIEVSSEEIGMAMSSPIEAIVNSIHKAIEQTPPELVSDLIENGIVLAGGGALIRDLPLRLQNEVRLPVRVAENPLISLAKGGEILLEDPDLLDKIQLEY
ncbi:MAG TPA: rod shape-determining protein [Pseudobdellovibrionaceae bacterium]|nr:rod shape-determining protein [Pseudobdellovibrionaceae bacterium]